MAKLSKHLYKKRNGLKIAVDMVSKQLEILIVEVCLAVKGLWEMRVEVYTVVSRLKIFLLLFFLLPPSTWAYVPESEVGEQNQRPEAIEGVGIDEKLNQRLPQDVLLIDENGNELKIADFYSSKKPLVLSLVYFSCPSLCNLHLRGVFEVFSELGLRPGKDFEFLAVSIDPEEDFQLAGDKKKGYVSTFLKDGENPGQGIHFLVGNQENISKLAQAVGFRYKWNQELEEWSHASAAIITTPRGLISRYLHGVYFDSKTFRLSVVEASRGVIGNLTDNFALFCFRYDSKKNKYSLHMFNVLRGITVLFLLLFLLWLVPFWLKFKTR